MAVLGIVLLGMATVVWRLGTARLRLDAAREVLQLPMGTPEGPRSALDLFWEMGASAWALEVLARRGLLNVDNEQAWRVAFQEELRIHGGWRALLDDLRAAKEEVGLEEERLLLPTLFATRHRLLEMAPTAPDGIRGPEGPTAWALPSPPPEVFDIDALPETHWLELVDGFFRGELGAKLQAWWSGRQVQRARTDLDAALVALVAALRCGAGRTLLEERVSLPWHAWTAEMRRLEALQRSLPVQGDHVLAARALLLLAVERAAGQAAQAAAFRESVLRAIEAGSNPEYDRHLGWQLFQHRESLLNRMPPDVTVALQRVEQFMEALRVTLRSASSGRGVR